MPFKKGETGNPKGRPKKGECLTDILREELEKPGKGNIKKKTLLVKKVLELALDKDDRYAVQYIWDRIDGKVKETHTVETEGVEIRFVNATKKD